MTRLAALTRRSRRERGVAAVEFALVVPILFSLILGIVEYGTAFNYRTQLNNAAQLAARTYAVEKDWDAARAAFAGLTPAGVTPQITRSFDCTPAKAGEGVTVTVKITRPTLTKFFGTSFNYESRGVYPCS